MTGKNETLHLKISQHIVVTDRHVTLGKIAKMEGTEEAILRQLKQKKIFSFSEDDAGKNSKNRMQVFSILKIIELIHEEYPQLEISNEGEQDFILEYDPKPEQVRWMEILKVGLLCVVIFFGSAFTIMAFNNDVSVPDIFSKLYLQMMGKEASGMTELEISYCIGLSIGILVFFNHFGRKKITPDPTPIQVKMRQYEQDLDTAFIENAERKGHNIDVK